MTNSKTLGHFERRIRNDDTFSYIVCCESYYVLNLILKCDERNLLGGFLDFEQISKIIRLFLHDSGRDRTGDRLCVRQAS